VAHTYNPSYSEDRDQEDLGLKPAQANSWQDPILGNPSQKWADGVAQGKILLCLISRVLKKLFLTISTCFMMQRDKNLDMTTLLLSFLLQPNYSCSTFQCAAKNNHIILTWQGFIPICYHYFG
jgi:hypothetical protein